MRLSVKQYLLLNNLMYLEPEDGPFPDLRDFIGQRIGDYIGTIDVSMIRDDGRPRMTTAEEWKNIILAIARDSLILKMKIMTVHVDLSPDGGAGKSAVFLSTDTAEAAIVFKGTELVAGSAQWKDNFYSGNLTDTPHQLRALEWYRDVWQKYHLNQYEVTVTGHSKGGNKAKYITVVDGTPDHCVSFDGEGFSDLFFSKYGFEIARHEARIENHMVDYDYISPLLNDVGSCTYYYGNDYGIGGFTENHLANTFMRFGENGEFWIDVNEDGRPAEMLAFDEFANTFLGRHHDLFEVVNLVVGQRQARQRHEEVAGTTLEPRITCQYVRFAIAVVEELMGAVDEAMVEVVTRCTNLLLVVGQVFQFSGITFLGTCGEDDALAFLDVEFEVTGNVQILVAGIAAFGFLRVVDASVPVGTEHPFGLLVQLHEELGIAGIHAGLDAVLDLLIVAISARILVRELAYAPESQPGLQTQGRLGMSVEQRVADENAVLEVLEHQFLLQDDATDAIDGSGHLLAVVLADVLVSTRTVVVALILVQAEVEFSAMLDDRAVERRQQNVVLIVQLRHGHHEQTVVLARVAIQDGRTRVSPRTV